MRLTAHWSKCRRGRYLAHGTATDWMHEELHVPMAYTWEIYGNMTADFHDCFRMFNPVCWSVGTACRL